MIDNNESRDEIDKLQDIIKDLNDKAQDSVDKNVHNNIL